MCAPKHAHAGLRARRARLGQGIVRIAACTARARHLGQEEEEPSRPEPRTRVQARTGRASSSQALMRGRSLVVFSPKFHRQDRASGRHRSHPRQPSRHRRVPRDQARPRSSIEQASAMLCACGAPAAGGHEHKLGLLATELRACIAASAGSIATHGTPALLSSGATTAA